MRNIIHTLILAFVMVPACGPAGVEDGEQLESSDTSEMGEWSSCFTKDDFTTCADACANEGRTCVPSGCPATPGTCTPDDCMTATVAIAFNDMVCEDVSLGGFIDSTCEEPIAWQANSIGRCCCAP